MNAQERHARLIGELNKLLASKEMGVSAVPHGEFESRYKQLKATRDYFGLPWNEIETLIKATPYPNSWMWESRKDAAFKKYYGLRMKIDKMEVLIS